MSFGVFAGRADVQQHRFVFVDELFEVGRGDGLRAAGFRAGLLAGAVHRQQGGEGAQEEEERRSFMGLAGDIF